MNSNVRTADKKYIEAQKKLCRYMGSLRVQAGYSQLELGSLIGKSRSTIGNYENQKYPLHPATYNKIVAIFEASAKASELLRSLNIQKWGH